MPLTVLNVAYPFAPVGADSVGGAEQILAMLDRELVARGHHSIVIACEGSRVRGELFALDVPKCELTEDVRWKARSEYRSLVNRVLAHRPADLVHMHGIDFSYYLPPPGIPVLATLHLPIAWYPARIFQSPQPGLFMNCVSSSQQRTAPSCAALLPGFIENGIAADDWSIRTTKRHFAISLGRICPEKGFHLAMDAARKAGMPLMLGGEVFSYAEHQAYFQREIAPRLDRYRRFLGPLDLKRKRRLLSAAQCLVAPSLARETSSLVALEALACGTPVVAYPSGALKEIVEHGRTGYLVSTMDEMAEAIKASAGLDKESCRKSVRERFPLERTVKQYFAVYEGLATLAARSRQRAPGAARSHIPAVSEGRSAERPSCSPPRHQ